MTTESKGISFFRETIIFTTTAMQTLTRNLGRGLLNKHTQNMHCGKQVCVSEQMKKECDNKKNRIYRFEGLCPLHCLLSVSSHYFWLHWSQMFKWVLLKSKLRLQSAINSPPPNCSTFFCIIFMCLIWNFPSNTGLFSNYYKLIYTWVISSE